MESLSITALRAMISVAEQVTEKKSEKLQELKDYATIAQEEGETWIIF